MDVKIPKELQEILEDKVKVAYIGTFLFLGLFAYLLILQHDVGLFLKLRNTFRNEENNLLTAQTISGQGYCIDLFNKKYNIENGLTAQWLIEIITNTAEETAVSLIVVRPIESQVNSGYHTIRVLIEGMASYRGMSNFVSRLENNEKSIIIEEVSFTCKDIYSPEEELDVSYRETLEEEVSSYAGRLARFKLIAACLSEKE